MNSQSKPEKPGVASLPVITKMAEHYDLDAAAFVYTFKTVAMPANASDAEFVSCCLVAREHGLNPLTKEIYFMRTKAGAIQPIVSVDGWIKKCNEHPQYDGMELEDDRDANGKLTGMWCTIWRKDRSKPTRIREDLAECLAVGGPVWKSSPNRMMRNRVICQCARVAFGFAGLMEPDEFAAWQGMKDVTPTKVVDIPDAIDPPSPEPESQEITINDLGHVNAYLVSLKSAVAFCDSEQELAKLRTEHAPIIASMKPADRKKALRILDGEHQ